MYKLLAKLKPRSRKLIVLVITVAGMIANDMFDQPITKETMLYVLGLVGTWILGQGIADHGTQGAANAAKRAVQDGDQISMAVNGVLRKVKESDEDDLDDDGPYWEDTSEMDEEDQLPVENG